MRLTPTERLAVLSLKLTPGQTVNELAESTGTIHRHNLVVALRLLVARGLVAEHTTEGQPSTFTVAPEAAK